MPATEPLTIIVITTAVPGQEQKLRAVQETLVAETLAEPGCLRYELHQSLEDGRVLIFVESWASEPAWRAHLDGDAIRHFKANGAGQLIASSTLYQMKCVAGAAPA